jgi:hypothetical protein
MSKNDKKYFYKILVMSNDINWGRDLGRGELSLKIGLGIF